MKKTNLKATFYIYGLSKGELTVVLRNPLMIIGRELHEFTARDFSKFIKKLKVVDVLENNRVLTFKNKGLVTSFLKDCSFIDAPFKGKGFNLAPLDKEKIFLLKLHKIPKRNDAMKRKIWNIIEKLKILSKKEFDKITEEGIISQEYGHGKRYNLEKIQFSTLLGENDELIIGISLKNTKEYPRLKKKIKSLMGTSLKKSYPKEWKELTKKKVPKSKIDEYLLKFVARLLREVKNGKREEIDLGDGFGMGVLVMDKKSGYHLDEGLCNFLIELGDYQIVIGKEGNQVGSMNTPKEVEIELKKVAKKLGIKLDL